PEPPVRPPSVVDPVASVATDAIAVPLEAKQRFLSSGVRRARGARPAVVAAAKPEVNRAPSSETLSLDTNWELGINDDAVDYPAPLLELIQNSLAEVALMGSYDQDKMLSLVQLGNVTPTESLAQNVPRLHIAVGVVKKNDWTVARANLAEMTSELETLADGPSALPERSHKPPGSKTIELGEEQARLDQPVSPQAAIFAQPTVLDARAELSKMKSETENAAESVAAVFLKVPPASSVTDVAVVPPADRLADSGALPSARAVSDAPKGEIIATQDAIAIAPKASVVTHAGAVSSPAAPNLVVAMNNQPQVPSFPKSESKDETNSLAGGNDKQRRKPETKDDVSSARDRGGPISGVLEVSADADQWLDAKKGHIELYLKAKDSADPEDIIFIEYTFPEADFEIDGQALHHAYEVVAGVYLPDSSEAFATVDSGKIVGPGGRGRVRFSIDKAAIFKSAATKKRTGYVPLTLTVYEGLSGNYRQPQPVAGAKVQIVGFGGLGEAVAGSDGSLKLPMVPIHSELLVRVSAPSYLPTERVIPVFETPAYVPVYLLPKTKIDDVSRYFVQNQQRDDRSVLIGRVFDPVERIPKALERFSLSYRRGGPIYFGALPDSGLRETTNQGLFGFFNVAPAFRVLSKDEGAYGHLNQFRSGFGYYVEWGRGGAKPIRGRLEDPFNHRPLHGKISWLEKADKAIETEQDNRFEFKGVDLPLGVITLEVDSLGYPKTWHTIPWSTRERADERTFHMLEGDLLREGAKSFARIPKRAGLGTIVGGAAPGFFARTECVDVVLKSVEGAMVSEEQGPYYFSKRKMSKEAFCLTSKEPGFTYVNLEPGDYLLQFKSARHHLLRTRFIRVGSDRVSVAVQ
ncbi:MAG: hypothetical protein HYR96_12080, partial [Deltaproteobacteria bacterium]|nr:hypothetical protein [Deltaproteobacteria bacterium]